MNNLDVSFKIKRRNRSLITQPQQKLHKTASQHKKLSPFSKLEKPFHQTPLQSSKMLPKNMMYDKESLYLEVLSLKMELNQIMDQNIRLKTRIVALQKQIGSSGNNKIHNSHKYLLPQFSRDKYDLNRHNEGLLIDGLKKMIKQTKKQCQILKNQNLTFKKNLKISKTNELEIQLSTIIEQNRRVLTINEQLQRKLIATQAKNEYLQKGNMAIKNELKCMEQQATTLKSYIKAIQLQQRIQISNFNVKQRQHRQINSQKRKQMRNIQQVKKDLLFNKEASFRINKKQHFRAMRVQYNMLPVRREPIPIRLLKDANKATIVNNQQSLHIRNRFLQEENKRLIKSCESLQRTLQKAKERINEIQRSKHKQQNHNQAQGESIKVEENVFQTNDKQKRQASETAKIEYSSAQNQQTNQHNQKINQQQGFRAHSEPQSSPIKPKQGFKTNKRVIGQICQLLTFRMMAQRYSYHQLKADIQQSASKQFSYIDLCHMFVNEPFYLTVDYCRILLSFIFAKEKPAHNDVISSMTLVAKLRKVIKDFEMINEQQQRRMIEKCANAVTEHSKQIRDAFAYVPNESKTVRHQQMRQMLSQLNLSDSESNLILSQLSICSNDLSHLNLDVLFQRFDLNQLSSDPPRIIEEAQNDDSFINSKHKEDLKNQQNIPKPHKNGVSQQLIAHEVGESKQTNVKNKNEPQLPA